MVVCATLVPHSAHTTTNISPSKRSLHCAQGAPYLRTLRSIPPALATPPQKNSTISKNIRQPCVFNVACQSPHYALPRAKPSARCSSLKAHRTMPPFRAIPVRHPRSTRKRLAPLPTVSKQSTPLRYAALPLASGRLMAVLPALYGYARTSPRPPTPSDRFNAVETLFTHITSVRLRATVQLLYTKKPNHLNHKHISPPETKGNANITTLRPLVQGQALRVAFKKNLHTSLRFG